MSSLLAIRDGLREFASCLHLNDEDLPGIFETNLLNASASLEDNVAEEFSLAMAKRAVALRLASKVLVGDPSPDSMAHAIEAFGALIAGLRRELGQRPSAAEWNFARQVAGIAQHLCTPRPPENPQFAELPRMLGQSDWLRARMRTHAAAAGIEFSTCPASAGLHREQAKRWLRRSAVPTDARLCATLEQLLGAVENRARQVWFLRQSAQGEHPLPRMYVLAHAELFPDLHSPISETRLTLEVAKLKSLALDLRLPDLALCFDSTEWMAQYALSFLLPPAPGEWAVRSASHLRRLLHGRISRWYSCPFDHRIEPLEMAATVLRAGRPLFYEHVAAHALLEYSLLQCVSFSRQSAASWLQVQSGLENEFETLFDAYLLCLLHYPRLRSPEGWCRYLGALDTLHYGGPPDAEFQEFRHGFFARRGLQSSIEILYRTTQSHSAIN